jgi:hypothetical protein
MSRVDSSASMNALWPLLWIPFLLMIRRDTLCQVILILECNLSLTQPVHYLLVVAPVLCDDRGTRDQDQAAQADAEERHVGREGDARALALAEDVLWPGRYVCVSNLFSLKMLDIGAVSSACATKTMLDIGAVSSACATKTMLDIGAVSSACATKTMLDIGAVSSACATKTMLDIGAVSSACATKTM